MGLREKVALVIIVVLFVQILYGECVSNTKKFQAPHKPRRSKLRKHAKTIQKPAIVREESVARRFNFPETENTLPMSLTSTLFPKPIREQQCIQENILQSLSKKEVYPSKYKRRKHKMNRKTPYSNGVSSKISPLMPYTEIETLSKPICLNNKDFFPSVDYPLDVTDLWTPHYWNRIPQIQPEIKCNIQEMNINSQANKEISKISRGTKKNTAIDILKGLINTEKKNIGTTKSNIINENSVSNCKNKTFTINTTPEENMSPSSIGKDSFTVTNSYDNTPTITTSHFIQPLTTALPYCKDHTLPLNVPDEDKNENSDIADEMGYTLMNPEVFDYVSTSTVSPLADNNVDLWMSPELDNHTLNTYSDEIDQCYILVN